MAFLLMRNTSGTFLLSRNKYKDPFYLYLMSFQRPLLLFSRSAAFYTCQDYLKVI